VIDMKPVRDAPPQPVNGAQVAPPATITLLRRNPAPSAHTVGSSLPVPERAALYTRNNATTGVLYPLSCAPLGGRKALDHLFGIWLARLPLHNLHRGDADDDAQPLPPHPVTICWRPGRITRCPRATRAPEGWGRPSRRDSRFSTRGRLPRANSTTSRVVVLRRRPLKTTWPAGTSSKATCYAQQRVGPFIYFSIFTAVVCAAALDLGPHRRYVHSSTLARHTYSLRRARLRPDGAADVERHRGSRNAVSCCNVRGLESGQAVCGSC